MFIEFKTMANNKQYQKISPETQTEALKVAKATQRPGQTKEQTKLIAQGIQKGIDQYKKQQKVKSRELNKKIHKVAQQLESSAHDDEVQFVEEKSNRSVILPWVLLASSWLGFIAYYCVTSGHSLL
jgi:hypothetical protein